MHPRKAASWSGVLPFASDCERKVWTRDLDSKRIFNVCVDRALIAARWRIVFLVAFSSTPGSDFAIPVEGF